MTPVRVRRLYRVVYRWTDIRGKEHETATVFRTLTEARQKAAGSFSWQSDWRIEERHHHDWRPIETEDNR